MDLHKLTSAEILGLTIIGEARGEPIEGQVAVGSVIRNRLKAQPLKYKTYHDVVLAPKQFSCWLEDDPNRPFLVELAEKMFLGQPLTDRYIKQCLYVGYGIHDDDIIDNTGGAQNYLTTQLFTSDDKPSWAKNVKNVRSYGNQTFFNV